ncbi:hypothetical protein L228DRAFT_84382 [Xylona heveae TC161]|uniref:Ca2+-modulated nonselective cation channel polycystin n=1 Tax=Xylona heveae (strain CBS 132557 / TC161) TaxID=1328760 RepID=A0A165J6W5_XYLHT|nr:hypothetical protein L228DRAFT_84382 [Xylona heveae TC161]KZF25819.1 hypothetical protein L228DRAFT_84382 [Xylona heveae TC161]
MAAADVAAGHHDRPSRRRPFSAWMRRLTNLKGLSSESNNHGSSKRHNADSVSKSKKIATKNNPYPSSALPPPPPETPASSGNGHLSFLPDPPRPGDSVPSLEQRSHKSDHDSGDYGPQAPMASNRSAAPTLATNPDTVNSDAAYSKAGTTGTGLNGGGGGSTFSSPAPSVRSLTTTLTTIQSTAPSTLLPGGGNTPSTNTTATGQQQNNHSYHQHTPSNQNQSHTQFTHQFPTQPVTAIPAHLAPQVGGGHPSTYTTATANNLLTDNASVLTLASSTKRRRRHSLDTDASVRALAPSSLWGGSRESLPLSVLSGNVADSSGPGGATPSGIYQPRPSLGGVASAERASVYSSSGVVAPQLTGDRSSYYGGKQGTVGGDGASMRSGILEHGRNDSVSGSISGIGGGGVSSASPATPAPRDVGASATGRLSRRSSNWGEVSEANSEAGEDPESKPRESEKKAE